MPAPLYGPRAEAARYGDPVWIGTITATTTKDNADTAVPFSITGEMLKGKSLMLQGDAAFYFKQQPTAAAGVTSSNGTKVQSDTPWFTDMRSSKGYLAILPVSGTVNVKVFEMNA